MIRRIEKRSGNIMHKQEPERDHDSFRYHRALDKRLVWKPGLA